MFLIFLAVVLVYLFAFALGRTARNGDEWMKELLDRRGDGHDTQE